MTANHDLMLISSSYVADEEHFLGYCKQDLQRFLHGATRLLFVPFAYSRHEKYTELVRSAMAPLGVVVTGAHTVDLKDSEAIASNYDVVFCGGGNTFLLLSALYERGLLKKIRDAVDLGVRYMGSSAGANVACPTIGTTNDMPIVEPESLKALHLIPFNINPHYYDRPRGFKHMGESRGDRIREFVTQNPAVPVLALREGAILMVTGSQARLAGRNGGIVFKWRSAAQSIEESKVAPGGSVDYLLGQPEQ